ncbi:unnamed protein product [Mytilus coruscus]|uniref:Uncharacterized protein n=1 Tax=Mytilus coruscus TaxID=42192 RepID=A0A6J8D7P2_MYTCO|nr:unnamed protein product [Mytilus coruscus]
MSDTTDEEYGNNDDETAFVGRRRMKKIHLSKRRVDKNSTCRENLDGFLPVHTSQWNLPCLESLCIFYSEKPLPLSELLDIVYKNTSMFEPLTLNQTKVVNYLQNSLDFCTSIGDVMIYSRRYPREIGRDLLEEIKKNLEKDIFKNNIFER